MPVLKRLGSAILAVTTIGEMMHDKDSPHIPHGEIGDRRPAKEVAANISSAHTITFVGSGPITFVGDSSWPIYFSVDRALLELSLRCDGRSYKIVS